jgi:CBS domain containing-hemolysin-like protein
MSTVKTLLIYFDLGLKTLVSLHQSVNPADVDALTEDEVTIIGAVLDLRSKPVSQIMTPIADVFTLSTEDLLDEELVDKVSSKLTRNKHVLFVDLI